MPAPLEDGPGRPAALVMAMSRLARMLRYGSPLLAMALTLGLAACGKSDSGDCSPEECVCDAADEAVFDNCNPGSFFDRERFIRPALEACDIFASDAQIEGFRGGDVEEECLASGFAAGLDGDEADDVVDALEDLDDCAEVADLFVEVCGQFDQEPFNDGIDLRCYHVEVIEGQRVCLDDGTLR